mmetsp:Transcript_101280/g.326429  ORF Transcript_101280/g.326429 Transcript_101280/m.326429 type:complete len:209 (-) Transcript_101280:1507-2133(-)
MDIRSGPPSNTLGNSRLQRPPANLGAAGMHNGGEGGLLRPGPTHSEPAPRGVLLLWRRHVRRHERRPTAASLEPLRRARRDQRLLRQDGHAQGQDQLQLLDAAIRVPQVPHINADFGKCFLQLRQLAFKVPALLPGQLHQPVQHLHLLREGAQLPVAFPQLVLEASSLLQPMQPLPLGHWPDLRDVMQLLRSPGPRGRLALLLRDPRL